MKRERKRGWKRERERKRCSVMAVMQSWPDGKFLQLQEELEVVNQPQHIHFTTRHWWEEKFERENGRKGEREWKKGRERMEEREREWEREGKCSVSLKFEVMWSVKVILKGSAFCSSSLETETGLEGRGFEEQINSWIINTVRREVLMMWVGTPTFPSNRLLLLWESGKWSKQFSNKLSERRPWTDFFFTFKISPSFFLALSLSLSCSLSLSLSLSLLLDSKIFASIGKIQIQ